MGCSFAEQSFKLMDKAARKAEEVAQEHPEVGGTVSRAVTAAKAVHG